MKNNITAILRVKNEAGNIRECLDSIRPFVDSAVVVDDNSTDNTLAIAKSDPLVSHAVCIPKPYFHEGLDLSTALSIAQLTQPDWILKVDADEIWEPRFAQYIKKLIAIPDAKAFAFHYCNIVDGKKNYDLYPFRWALFKNDPKKIFYWLTKYHTPVPHMDEIPGQWILTNLRIQHNGYIDKKKKIEQARKLGYVFGDYLTPRYKWNSKITSPVSLKYTPRPDWIPKSITDLKNETWVPRENDKRFPDFHNQIERTEFMNDYALRHLMWPEALQEVEPFMHEASLSSSFLLRIGITLIAVNRIDEAAAYLQKTKTGHDAVVASFLMENASRLKNSLPNHIDDLCDITQNNQDKMWHRLTKMISQYNYHRIAIYGAGKFWAKMYQFLAQAPDLTDFLLIDDQQCGQDTLTGKPIKNSSELPDIKPDCIILATDSFTNEMRSNLSTVFQNKNMPPILAYPFLDITTDSASNDL